MEIESNKAMLRMEQIPYLLILLLFVGSCKTTGQQTNPGDQGTVVYETERMIIIKGDVVFKEVTQFDKPVTIYPESFVSTSGNGKIIFNKTLNVIGNTPVFSDNINIQFGEGCIGTLNVGWFGAMGYDREDDTKAFQKALQIASVLHNSVTIYVPIGKYWISEQLVLENTTPLNKSINLFGEGMSNSTNDGSSIIWNGNPGASMILVRNNYQNLIQSLDFAAETHKEVKHNIELRPHIYQLEFRDCSFSGSSGEGSSNINLNEGNSTQVSEISLRNCIFHGLTLDNKTWLTASAIKGGRANTKNFYFDKCAFMGYTDAAINIDISEIVNINNCTFSHNTIDIACMLCNMLATSNYSEQSKFFFKCIESSNLAFTTMINNYFDGNLQEDFVIPKGAGSLVLINNNFGGNGGIDSINLIKWDSRNISSIYSIGNFFRNDSTISNTIILTGKAAGNSEIIHSTMDKVGKDGTTSRKLN